MITNKEILQYSVYPVCLDYNNQGMVVEINDEEDEVDLSWFSVNGHNGDPVTDYPFNLIEGVDCIQLWQENGGTGLLYATCTEAQALKIIQKL